MARDASRVSGNNNAATVHGRSLRMNSASTMLNSGQQQASNLSARVLAERCFQ